MSDMTHSPTSSGGADLLALASSVRTVRARLPPTSAAWSLASQLPPSLAITSVSASSQSGSESISSPSMSNRTAAAAGSGWLIR